jgi:hypothetical protein
MVQTSRAVAVPRMTLMVDAMRPGMSEWQAEGTRPQAAYHEAVMPQNRGLTNGLVNFL